MDERTVTLQIGRPPRGEWSVAKRCACGCPQVLETSSRLDDGTPFPTRYWLTCKTLNSAIGTLESSGWMARINQQLKTDRQLRSSLAASMQCYISERESRMESGSVSYPGGSEERVKCLHAHTAHHLMTGDNPVGARVLQELDWVDPQLPCVQL